MKINYFEAVKRLTLLDDVFMTVVFQEEPELVEFSLKIILNLDLKVKSVRVQDTLVNLKGRGVRFDIHAVSADGKHFDIEIQRQDSGANVKRARYNSSMLDANILLAGEDTNALPETYVIFITEHDVLKLNEPIYFIERVIVGKDKFFDDGAHIVYVNNSIRDDTPLGKLMHDFACADPDEMIYPIFFDKAGSHKKDKKKVMKLVGVMEEIARDVRRETTKRVRRETAKRVRRETAIKSIIDMAKKMLRKGKMSFEEIAEYCNLPLEKVQELAKEKID